MSLETLAPGAMNSFTEKAFFTSCSSIFMFTSALDHKAKRFMSCFCLRGKQKEHVKSWQSIVDGFEAYKGNMDYVTISLAKHGPEIAGAWKTQKKKSHLQHLTKFTKVRSCARFFQQNNDFQEKKLVIIGVYQALEETFNAKAPRISHIGIPHHEYTLGLPFSLQHCLKGTCPGKSKCWMSAGQHHIGTT